jgi:serine-type D-Ala-D-Ala carboxypeptidase
MQKENLLKAKAVHHLRRALLQGECSAVAVVAELNGGQPLEWFGGFHGRPALAKWTAPVSDQSIFDLASVSKAVSTVALLFGAESEGLFSWKDPVCHYFPWFPPSVTWLDLTCHRSGLPAHQEFFQKYRLGEASLGDPRAVIPWIEAAGFPETGKQVYSDLGFMLLGFFLEQIYKKSLLEIFHERIVRRLGLQRTGYRALPHSPSWPTTHWLNGQREDFVTTEDCPWRLRTLQGEVHDDNTWSMGGVAGHAGIFSTARETLLMLKHLWRQARACPDFLKQGIVPPGVFQFGLMTYPGLRPFPGPFFADSVGHTGFTGTSAWVHPSTGSFVVCLTNRVHPSRQDNRWIQTRLNFHEALGQEFGIQ